MAELEWRREERFIAQGNGCRAVVLRHDCDSAGVEWRVTDNAGRTLDVGRADDAERGMRIAAGRVEYLSSCRKEVS